MSTAAMTSPWAANGGALGMIGFAGFVIWLVWIVTYGVRLEERKSELKTHEPMGAMA